MTTKRLNIPKNHVGDSWSQALTRELTLAEFLDKVETTDILDNAVTADKIATDAVVADGIAASAVGTSEIADEAVTEDKLVDGLFVPADGIVMYEGTTAPTGWTRDTAIWHPMGTPYVALNGTDEYLWVADHADLDLAGDFAMSFIIRSDTAAAGYVIYKSAATSGYYIRTTGTGTELQIDLRNSVDQGRVQTSGLLTLGVSALVKIVYDASAAEISVYKNGVEASRINNSTATGGSVVSGTIPTSIDTNATNVALGATTAPANFLGGTVANLGILATEDDNGNALAPASCAAFWPLAFGPYDISGNDHHLTEVNLDTTNYRQEPLTDYIYIRRT